MKRSPPTGNRLHESRVLPGVAEFTPHFPNGVVQAFKSQAGVGWPQPTLATPRNDYRSRRSSSAARTGKGCSRTATFRPSLWTSPGGLRRSRGPFRRARRETGRLKLACASITSTPGDTISAQSPIPLPALPRSGGRDPKMPRIPFTRLECPDEKIRRRPIHKKGYCGPNHWKAATIPRNTVIDALGRVNVVCEPAATTVATGGGSGSAGLFGPGPTQKYCPAPKVTRVTGPKNEPFCLLLASSIRTRTLCGLFSSRLTSMIDQFPSGRCTAYDVTSTLPSPSLMSVEDGNI